MSRTRLIVWGRFRAALAPRRPALRPSRFGETPGRRDGEPSAPPGGPGPKDVAPEYCAGARHPPGGARPSAAWYSAAAISAARRRDGRLSWSSRACRSCPANIRRSSRCSGCARRSPTGRGSPRLFRGCLEMRGGAVRSTQKGSDSPSSAWARRLRRNRSLVRRCSDGPMRPPFRGPDKKDFFGTENNGWRRGFYPCPNSAINRKMRAKGRVLRSGGNAGGRDLLRHRGNFLQAKTDSKHGQRRNPPPAVQVPARANEFYLRNQHQLQNRARLATIKALRQLEQGVSAPIFAIRRAPDG